MKDKLEFGSWEARTVLINLVFAQIMLTFPKDMAYLGGSAGWMIPIGITLITIIYFAIVAALFKNVGSMDLVDISEKIGGRVLKVIVGLLVSFFLLVNISTFLGAFSQTLKLISLDKSPLGYVEFIFVIGSIAAAYFGIEAIVRINSFLVPVIIASFILITIGVIPKFNFNNLFPVWGNGFVSLVQGSILKSSVFSSLLILFFMVPFFKRKYVKRVGFISIVISGVLLLWATLAFLLVFSYQIAVDKTIPIFQMARHMEFANVSQRIESVSVLICSISSLLYLGIMFTFLIYILEKTLSLKRSKPIILPMVIIVFSLTNIIKKMNIELVNTGIVNYFWMAGLVLPLVILICGAAKKVGLKVKGGKDNE